MKPALLAAQEVISDLTITVELCLYEVNFDGILPGAVPPLLPPPNRPISSASPIQLSSAIHSAGFARKRRQKCRLQLGFLVLFLHQETG